MPALFLTFFPHFHSSQGVGPLIILMASRRPPKQLILQNPTWTATLPSPVPETWIWATQQVPDSFGLCGQAIGVRRGSMHCCEHHWLNRGQFLSPNNFYEIWARSLSRSPSTAIYMLCTFLGGVLEEEVHCPTARLRTSGKTLRPSIPSLPDKQRSLKKARCSRVCVCRQWACY